MPSGRKSHSRRSTRRLLRHLILLDSREINHSNLRIRQRSFSLVRLLVLQRFQVRLDFLTGEEYRGRSRSDAECDRGGGGGELFVDEDVQGWRERGRQEERSDYRV